MANSYRHLIVERHGNAACVRLAKSRMDESEVHEMAGEVLHLAREGGCSRVALCLGPRTPECLYSVFLARLISLERRLREMGGGLKLCQCTEQVIDILDACVLLERFDIVPDAETALVQWGIDPANTDTSVDGVA